MNVLLTPDVAIDEKLLNQVLKEHKNTPIPQLVRLLQKLARRCDVA